MKLKSSLLIAAVALSFPLYALAQTPPDSNFEAQVKISKVAAEQLALDRVPQGAIKRQMLEQRGNQRVWVIDVARYNDAEHVTTVEVDADTGATRSGMPQR